jgi:hypothetical protein
VLGKYGPHQKAIFSMIEKKILGHIRRYPPKHLNDETECYRKTEGT